ncbi:hypothetical protein WN48_01985 [Eufriesea mexicana]|nr:hypothetical protein WN48_01985 [Eufriesea mexicana]
MIEIGYSVSYDPGSRNPEQGRALGCEFPAQWNGHWFQSGYQGLVTVNGSMMTSKGHCIETEGDKFLIQDTVSTTLEEDHKRQREFKTLRKHGGKSFTRIATTESEHTVSGRLIFDVSSSVERVKRTGSVAEGQWVAPEARVSLVTSVWKVAEGSRARSVGKTPAMRQALSMTIFGHVGGGSWEYIRKAKVVNEQLCWDSGWNSYVVYSSVVEFS